jgi:hypothetical protein
LPGLDERLLGEYVEVRARAGAPEVCDASFVEIETYARQIVEQLVALVGYSAAEKPSGSADPIEPTLGRAKAYDVEAIRQKHNQAYAPWSPEADEYLRSRFLEGATIDDLSDEFGRQPGGIRSRLRKLGYDVQGNGPAPDPAARSQPATGGPVSSAPLWRAQRPRAGCVWTPDEDRKLLEGIDAELPLEVIANTLGRGVFSVEVRLCKLGRIAPDRRRA